MAESSQTRIDTADILAIDDSIARSSGSAGFGITREGFIPKPFPRLLAEKLALARTLLGEELDLTSGSLIRKILEITALEEMRTWATLGTWFDNTFAISATGVALDALGAELGLERPHLEARGTITLTLLPPLPDGNNELVIPRGARLLTAGGHHIATDERISLSPTTPKRDVPVVAFYPGPEHNLDPGADPNQQINAFNWADKSLIELVAAEKTLDRQLVQISHTSPLTGGELRWPDTRYRELLLSAPRSIWTVDAVQTAISLVPGVRQVQVRDAWGGLDLNQSIFGNFNFIERLFGSERDLGSPYYFTVLVAPTASAIWEGTDGLRASIESAIEDLRPIGIFPNLVRAEEVGIGVSANLVVRGLPLPSGTSAVVNESQPAVELKKRLQARLRRYVDSLPFGEPVRSSEATWAFMNEPGVADVRNLQLLRYPPAFDTIDLTQPQATPPPQKYGVGENIDLGANQIPVFVDDAGNIVIV